MTADQWLKIPIEGLGKKIAILELIQKEYCI